MVTINFQALGTFNSWKISTAAHTPKKGNEPTYNLKTSEKTIKNFYFCFSAMLSKNLKHHQGRTYTKNSYS